MKKLLLASAFTLLGAGCVQDTWIGIYYPDASNLLVDERSWELDSVEECRSWIKGQQIIYNLDGEKNDDYECCKNGEYDPEWDMFICDETAR